MIDLFNHWFEATKYSFTWLFTGGKNIAIIIGIISILLFVFYLIKGMTE